MSGDVQTAHPHFCKGGFAMENIIIIAIVLLAAALGLRETIKHFKGKGGCCGGGSYKPKKKKLPCVLYQKTFQVGGMHCEHCRQRVEEIVNDMKGLAGRVNLKTGELTVSYAQDTDDAQIIARIERAGYTVTKRDV